MTGMVEDYERRVHRRQPIDEWLRARPDRYSCCGFHPVQGHSPECAPVAPELGKARGQAAASNAHFDERAHVEAAIRQLAATGRPFSANQARDLHGVKGGVVGAAFSALAKEGVIRKVGYEPSTEPGTHAHPVATWQGVAAA